MLYYSNTRWFFNHAVLKIRVTSRETAVKFTSQNGNYKFKKFGLKATKTTWGQVSTTFTLQEPQQPNFEASHRLHTLRGPNFTGRVTELTCCLHRWADLKTYRCQLTSNEPKAVSSVTRYNQVLLESERFTTEAEVAAVGFYLLLVAGWFRFDRKRAPVSVSKLQNINLKYYCWVIVT